MSEVVKVTSKGQITLPAKIRNVLSIDKDSYLIVEQIGDYVVMKRAEMRLREIQKIMRRAANDKKVTKQDLLNALKKARSEKWAR